MKKKKPVKKRGAKKPKKQQRKQAEIVVRVQQQSTAIVPTTKDLSEPVKDGKRLTIPKTWITSAQLIRLTEKTPPAQIYRRPAKGGGEWEYVTVSYVQRLLDYVFGWNWDFEIVEHGKEADHVWVLGRLTVRSQDGKYQIVKTQFGRSEVKKKRDGGGMLDYGNDLKAAASDALKKCASMLGIARDVYGKADYREETGRGPIESREHVEIVPEDKASAPEEPIYCHGIGKSGCPHGAEITKQQREFSVKLYGKPLCNKCQKETKPLRK